MNILFFTFTKVCATSGGTERATISVATGLAEKYGFKCYSLYETPSNSAKEDCFVEEFCWANKSSINEKLEYFNSIVTEYDIAFVIIQGSFIHTKLFVQQLKGSRCKVIFAHHFEPRSEKRFITFEYTLHHISCKSLKALCRGIVNITFFPFIHKRNIKALKHDYQNTYVYAEVVVLLSKSFIEPYRDFASINGAEKFRIIPNPLSFNEFLKLEDLPKKRKEVLIVARFDDKFKNISLALRIWALVQKDSFAKNWTLRIVGYGKDSKLYQTIIAEEHIPNVTLEGRQNPVPYYKFASLFMMTSNSESWGLTLTEAMQFGTVPIAINSYPSLAEIITDKENGILIPKGDITRYAHEMLRLMQNEKQRHAMACSAIKSSKRFSQDAIASRWFELLAEIQQT